MIFNDDNFGGNHYEIDIAEFMNDKRHRIYKFAYRKANWISWNLPVGTVMTMMECNKTVEKDQSLADLRGCGCCVALVGTGQTEAVNLSRIYMDDCLTGFFWCEIDLKMGAIEIFDATDFGLKEWQGWRRKTIFLCEWAPGIAHSMTSWRMDDKISKAVFFYRHFIERCSNMHVWML